MATLTQTSLRPVETYGLHGNADERRKTLHRLLEENHTKYAVLFRSDLLFHNHAPHALGSSYVLGSNSERLQEIFDHDKGNLRSVDDGLLRGAVNEQNWRSCLGQREYVMSFEDFFDSEIAKAGGDWRKVLEKYLYSGDEPLVNGFTAGLGHPFIHLAYAYEFESKEVATEALTLGCVEYPSMHTLIDQFPKDNSTYKTASLAEVIERVKNDTRFDGHFEQPGFSNIETIMTKQQSAVLEHWNAWAVTEPLQQLEEAVDTAILLAMSHSVRTTDFDFFLAHVLTTAHALRVILPIAPENRHVSILRQYGLFVILTYISQLKPKFSDVKAGIESYDITGKGWDWVSEQVATADKALDEHFPKVVRAFKAAEETWGGKNDYYRKAAVKFATEWKQWAGFGEGV